MSSVPAFFYALGWAVLNSFWQVGLLWASYHIFLPLRPGLSSSRKANLASVAMMAGFLWFSITFFSALFVSAPQSAIQTPWWDQQLHQLGSPWIINALPILAIGYLLLIIFPVYRLLKSIQFVRKLRRKGLSRVPIQWRSFVNRHAALLDIRRPVAIWFSANINTPVTIGYLKPLILLPVSTLSQLSIPEVEAILLHELAHIRRRDYLWNYILKIIQVLLYFNPFIRLLNRVVDAEREKNCDEWVLAYQSSPVPYINALVNFRSESRVAGFLMAVRGQRFDLLQRVERMLGKEGPIRVSPVRIGALITGMALLLAIPVLLLLAHPIAKTNGDQFLGYLPLPFQPFIQSEDPIKKPAPSETLAASPREVPSPKEVLPPTAEAIPAPLADPDYGAIARVEMPEVTTGMLNSATEQLTSTILPVALKLQEEKISLTEKEARQVEEAANLSSQLISEQKWKELETNLGELLTVRQRVELKKQFQDLVKQGIDKEELEEKVARAYNYIDWDEFKQKVDHSLKEIKIDSLSSRYELALLSLTQAKKAMQSKLMSQIPDRDKALADLDQQIATVRQLLVDLKKERTIISL